MSMSTRSPVAPDPAADCGLEAGRFLASYLVPHLDCGSDPAAPSRCATCGRTALLTGFGRDGKGRCRPAECLAVAHLTKDARPSRLLDRMALLISPGGVDVVGAIRLRTIAGAPVAYTEESLGDWLADRMMAPPRPPFLLIVCDKSTRYLDRVRVTSGGHVMHIGGAMRIEVDLGLLRRCVAVAGPLGWTGLNALLVAREACQAGDATGETRSALLRHLERAEASAPGVRALLADLPSLQSPMTTAIRLCLGRLARTRQLSEGDSTARPRNTAGGYR